MKKYHDLGTAGNVAPLSALGGLPVRNLAAASLPDPTPISGEHLAGEYLGRRLACGHCPVGCIHIAALREPHPEEPYFYKTSMISYDYELIYALGSMLGVTDTRGLLRLMDRVEAVGVDAISVGVVLAWATEAFEKGLVGTAETGGLTLRWGDAEGYMAAVGRIADAGGEFWRTLGRGVDAAAERYGGREFALALGGNEMAGYHTGPAAHLGFLIGCRHSHLDNAGYSADQKNAGKPLPEPEALVDSLVAEERWRQVLSSLAVCFAARGIYTPDVTSRALAAAGITIDEAGMRRLGEDVHRRKHAFRVGRGFDPAVGTLPARLLETPTPSGPLDPEYLRRGLARFRSLMAG
jgi:aldehyde:ferredoxin oxidoreductase